MTDAQVRVLVLGDAMLDVETQASGLRTCPDTLAPVLSELHCTDAPGGAANAAAQVRRLGAAVDILGAIGDDEAGRRVRIVLEDESVDPTLLLPLVGRKTLARERVQHAGRLLSRFDSGDTDPLAERDERELIRRLQRYTARCSAVLVSDYGYGVMSDAVIQALGRLRPRVLVVDAKRLERYRELRPAAVKPNFAQALALSGLRAVPEPRTAWVRQNAETLIERSGADLVAVTLDREGSITVSRSGCWVEPCRATSPPLAGVGAGDAYAAGLAVALARGEAPGEAVRHAAQAAAEWVESRSEALEGSCPLPCS